MRRSRLVFIDRPLEVARDYDAVAALPEGVQNKTELLEELAYQLHFPDYFGHNWDALEEALTELLPNQGKKILIVHREIPPLPITDLQKYLTVLRGVSEYREDRGDPPLDIVFPTTAEAELLELLAKTQD